MVETETTIPDLIAQLALAVDGNWQLDQNISDALGVGMRQFTTSFSCAYALLPQSVTNFYLFSFGGHGRDDKEGDCWGCAVHDRAQLVGEERAQRTIKRLNRSFKVDMPPSILYGLAIAEQFCEFSLTHAATPALAICGVALKVRIGRTTDDDLWPECQQ